MDAFWDHPCLMFSKTRKRSNRLSETGREPWEVRVPPTKFLFDSLLSSPLRLSSCHNHSARTLVSFSPTTSIGLRYIATSYTGARQCLFQLPRYLQARKALPPVRCEAQVSSTETRQCVMLQTTQEAGKGRFALDEQHAYSICLKTGLWAHAW